MNTMNRIVLTLLLAALPAVTLAAAPQPAEATGKVEGLYVEVAPDVYRPATAREAQTAERLWADVRFSKAAAGRERSAFVRVAQELRPENGDLVQVRLAQPLHPFAYALAPLTERDSYLALRAKYYTEAAARYGLEPALTASAR